MNSKNTTYRYVIIRFRPYVETEEFANVGILMANSDRGYFDFKLQSNRHARITRFFSPLDANLYKTAIAELRNEFMQMRSVLNWSETKQSQFQFFDNAPIDNYFHGFIQSSYGAIMTSKERLIRTDHPNKELQKLFEMYVNRNFGNEIANDIRIEKQVRTTLREADVASDFVEMTLRAGVYKKTFPFVTPEIKSRKMIKPMYLGNEDATTILDKAVKWRHSIRRFRESGQLSDDVAFTVEAPRSSARLGEAYSEAVSMLHEDNILTIPYQSAKEIVRFAKR